jgi:hypothetical protein
LKLAPSARRRASRRIVVSFALSAGVSACGSSGEPASPSPRGGLDGGGGGADATLGDAEPATDGASPPVATDGSVPCDDAGAPWTDPGVAPPAVDPAASAKVHHFFKISVVDKNGAPVVGATLTTTNATVYTSDKNGSVAYFEPGLMDTDVWFTPACSGYSASADGLGNVGIALHPGEGASGTVTMTKTGTVTAPSVGDLQTRLLAGVVPGARQCFAIRVVDSVTTRGVPLVELATGTGDAYWSDSQGMVAYCDPDGIGKTITFTVTSDGYALAAGNSVAVSAVAGGSQTVALVRALPGERLYRVTGQGIYRDSSLLGLTAPTANPNINGLVMGQDTPSTFVYGGKLYWIWQDTGRPAYPLGNFASSGAVSILPADGGLSADLGVNTTYFVGSDGFSRGMVDTAGDPRLTAGSTAPVWLGQVTRVVDAQSQPHVFAQYHVAASSNPWDALAELDPATSKFTFVADFPAGATIPAGRSTVVDGAAGPYAYWSTPVRFPATVDGVENLAAYEAFTAFGPKGSTTLAHNADGTLAYSWQPGGTVVTQSALTAAHVASDQALDGHLTDVATGGGVQVANGTGIAAFGSSSMWNDYRKRFGEIVQQAYGATFLGETWYAEADTPLGPWVFARKVVTHATSGYTFYNPDIVPFLSDAGGRIVFFDATYTKTYSNARATPRYDYNEMMYRVDLDAPAMALPVAIYSRASGSTSELVAKSGVRPGDPSLAPAFFAYDRPAPGAVSVTWSGPACASRRLTVGGQPATAPLFYALPPDGGGDAGAAAATVPLYEYTGPGGATVYSVDANLALAGTQRGAPVARVWPTPIRVAMPVADFLGDLVADGGPDQCVKATGRDGAHVSLDASATRDLAGPVAQYTWTLAGASCPIAAGLRADVVLPAGVNDIRVQATDAEGNTSSDEVVVEIAP